MLRKFLKEEEIVTYSNGWNLLSYKPQIKKIKDWNKKEGGKQGRSPSSFYQQATSQTTSQEGKKNKKKNLRKPYSTSYRIARIQKDSMDNFFNMASTLK
ncbi:hypothetical protein O181_080635 [Austropuccinia psidii MF-1]|uniref:Uncharacterized protein n=1 Tax=Austropuccinia psidii MF-1 TaxID=1389203 RepID=A0A9Q3FNJ7_9BASI|nr:hypothetical protein [Austropuccinia psidii MF-1]